DHQLTGAQHVLAHRLGGAVGVSVLDRLEDGSMLFKDIRERPRTPSSGNPPGVNEVAEPVDEVRETAVAARLQNDLVKPAVVLHEARLVLGLYRTLLRREFLAQRREIGWRELFGGPSDSGYLQQDPERKDLLQVVGGRLQDSHAAVALEPHHALGGEVDERLPNRSA